LRYIGPMKRTAAEPVPAPKRGRYDRGLSRGDRQAAQRERVLASRRSFTFASSKELADLYSAAGVRQGKSVITYCGRGYAAACGLLALKLLGHQDVRLYDGSWTEWSVDPNLPIEIGPKA